VFFLKAAIIYYSRTGNTEQAAEIIEEKLKEKNVDVDLIPIKAKKRPGFFRASEAAIKQIPLPIENSDFNLSAYDEIIVGVPSWANHPAPLYKSFLTKCKEITNKKFAIFITGGRSTNSNEPAIESMRLELDKIGINNIETELILKMSKGKIIDGTNNLDSFVHNIGE